MKTKINNINQNPMINKYLKGGKSEGMSLSQIAKLHKMNAEQLKPQLNKGIKHELEHTDSVKEARRIALDHLIEFPDYYDRLDKIEKMHLGGDMSKHLAPNGKPSNLSHEQWHIVRTPEFKAWFGDWENDPENASKVVDENGEPLVVYHGTIVENTFNTFDYDKADLGFHFGTKEQAQNRIKSKKQLPLRKSIVNSFFLNIRILFEMTDAGEWEYPQRYIDELMSDNIIEEKIAKQKGFLRFYDKKDNALIRDYIKSKYGNSVGFVYNNKYEGEGKSFIALSNNQMKLADGSNTTFNSENPDIRFHLGGDMSKHLAPNGKPSNLTHEQWHIVRTPEFKSWFGDWENDAKNASKVVDENGEPLVVFRGSKSKTPNYIPHKHELSNGIYFSTKKDVAELYTKSFWQNWVGRIFECFLNIRNLEYYDTLKLKSNIYQADFEFYNKLVIESKKNNFDGICWDNFIDVPDLQVIFPKEPEDYMAKTFIVFEPNQIKLADGTNTTFDNSSPDIRFAKGGRTIAQTRAPVSDRVYGSKTNPKGSASDSQLAKSIKFNDKLEKAIQNKVDAYNDKHPSDKVSLSTAKAVVRRGMGAYSKSHRPTISGGAPNSRQAWGLARLNKFLLKKSGAKVKSAYIQDDDLLKYEQGGEVVAKNQDIRSNLSNMDKEVKHTMGKAGGYLVGRRHSQGGIKAINNSTGQPLEMEGGEVVITRNAVSDDTKRMFEGEMLTNREILSRINQSGGGVSFEDGGEVTYCGNKYNYGGHMMTDHDILQEMATGGELDGLDEIEFEYGGDVSDIKLKNKIIMPITGVESIYYVNMYDDPSKLQIFQAGVYPKYSGRIAFRGLQLWSKGKRISYSSYNYANKKDFLSFIETTQANKTMLIPRMTGTMAMYDRFTEILNNAFQKVPFQYQTEKERTDWVIENPDFQNQVLEFFNEWETLEPNFVYREGVKKKITRTKKEDKFQYGVEAIKFGRSYDIKTYNNKLVKNDGNNSLIDLISKIIREYFTLDVNNPIAPLREDQTLRIPIKELDIVQKNTGVESSYRGSLGMGDLEMITSRPSRNLVLNKRQQYGNPKLVIDNVENLGGANILYYLLVKNGYDFFNDPTTWKKWFESGIIDYNIKLSLDDYCRVVGYVLARFCEETAFPAIRPIYNISEEPMMIEDVKMVLDFDDSDLSLYEGTQWYNWLMVSVLYYRANYVTQTSKAMGSMDARIAQEIKIGDIVEISEQEMQIVGFEGRDENLDLLKGKVIGIRSISSMRRPANPDGTMYSIRYFVPDKNGGVGGQWEAKDLVLMEKSEVQTTSTEEQPVGKKAPVGKNKKPLGDKSELDRNIYDLQYLISITSDFDFEVKMKLRQQLTEFQKLKDIIYATENSEDLIKASTPNYDGKYAIAIIQTMLDADSVQLKERPDASPAFNDGFQPNGEPTILNRYNYDLTQTPMFKEWFGDFTSAYDFKGLSGYDNIIPVSKVMTEGYEPLVVYQGLGRAFERERFDSFPTSYFAVNPNYAEWFATTKGQQNGTEGYVLPFFLNIRNPLDMTYFGIEKVSPKDFFDYLFVKTGQTAEQLGFDARFLQPNVPPMEVWAYIRNSPRAIESIKNQGVYDGFHFFENNPQASGDQYQTEVWTTFFPNQTKLASNERSKMLYSANQGFLMAKGGLIKK